MKTVLYAGMAVVLAAATGAFAQDPPKYATSSGSEDLEFVLDAARGGMAEVELGRLASQQAKSDEVKQFAQRMVDDHGKAGGTLKEIAESKSIALPGDLSPADTALKMRLEKLNGAAFDRAYMRAMVRDHTKDITEFTHESSAGRDPQVKAFASATLPTLEQHLQQARQARKDVSSTVAGN